MTKTIDISLYDNSGIEFSKFPREKMHQFFRQYLKDNRTCGNGNNEISKANVEAIADIQKYSDFFIPMKALECLFENFTFRSELSKGMRSKFGLYPVDGSKLQWISREKHLSSGSYGDTFVGQMFGFPNIKFVVKVPKIKKKEKDLVNPTIMEYFIGTAVINNFRKYCPNYCYTLGAMICEPDIETKSTGICGNIQSNISAPRSPLIFYEYIDGMILTDVADLPTAISALIQLLIALEIGQREGRFCHYDLKDDNCMITRHKKKFSVLLDDTEFQFNSKMLKIIDYGFSSATFKGKTACTSAISSLATYRRRCLLVQGFDMFMLIGCFANTAVNPAVRKFMSDLFTRYIPSLTASQVFEDGRHFASIISTSAASMSPLILLGYLLEDKTVQIITKGMIQLVKRTSLSLQTPLNLHKTYSNVFRTTLEDSIKCPHEYGSYLITKEVFQNIQKWGIFPSKQAEFRQALADKQMVYKLQMADFIMLSGLDISIQKMKTYLSGDKKPRTLNHIKVLSINYDRILEPIGNLRNFMEHTQFIDEIDAFMKVYYLILQLDLSEIEPYSDFCRKILTEVDKRTIRDIMAARRWCQTLIEELEYDVSIYE